MAIDTPEVQRGITKWTFIIAIFIEGITYFAGFRSFAYGLAFGVGLMILNYRVVSIILNKAFKSALPDLAKVLSFASYHIRFWIMVIIMYLVIPKAGFQFGVGSFFGILLPKIVMGVFVVINTKEEWWCNATPADKAPLTGKKRDDGLRFPGLDFDERFKNQEFKEPDDKLKL
ncbi:ATP synthase I [Thermincola ferriacetica]|uniref:ATP synthase I n=1 Tax=Thermincola ferriacetica TaxID=281456 RepID=A0A0L6VYT6_9FIRM|nr:hypothetical protein [Thermincola ferriacetica]KNZ68405.1 ATP synthase I [Thermincola ferriacetica]